MTEPQPSLGISIEAALGLISEGGYAAVEPLVAQYFASCPGRWFDRLVDRNQPDQLTTRDLVAVSMLGTAIDPHAAAWILDEGARPISDLLAQIPSGIELWLIDEAVLADDAPLAQLMRLLQHGRWPDSIGPNGIELAGATKLLAAKRPDLVPIYDVHVEVRLQPTPGQFIQAMRSGLSTPEQRIGPAIALAPIDRAQPDGIELSFLRRIDIALWMLHHEATLAAR